MPASVIAGSVIKTDKRVHHTYLIFEEINTLSRSIDFGKSKCLLEPRKWLCGRTCR